MNHYLFLSISLLLLLYFVLAEGFHANVFDKKRSLQTPTKDDYGLRGLKHSHHKKNDDDDKDDDRGKKVDDKDDDEDATFIA